MNKLLFVALVLIAIQACQTKSYVKNEGFVFGTMYHFTYESENGQDLEIEIKAKLEEFNRSLSTYDKNSIISRINQGDSGVVLDSYFINCFNKAKEISELTNGAFDMTVAPVVNAWGFGFDESIKADSNKIDSLMQLVGFIKISIVNNSIVKEKPGIMLDASAIAKGYGVDVAAEHIESKGIANYMVEIGGEVRVKGINAKGNIWRIGIDKPIESETLENRELQEVVSLNNKSLATSGNYRQFYEKNGVKYAHTINPETGFPAKNSLLSATVLANDCMTADALATAFMVMGVEKSINLANDLDSVEVYLIYTDSTNQYSIYNSENFIISNN